MLDEPSLGLAPAIVDQVYELLRADPRQRRRHPARRAERCARLRARRPRLRDERRRLRADGTPAEIEATTALRRRLFRRRAWPQSGRHDGQAVQTLVDALSVGGLYALTALGIGLIFGVMRLINFAHGELIMVAGYAAASPVRRNPPCWSCCRRGSSAPSCWRLLIERVAFRPLARRRSGDAAHRFLRRQLLHREDADHLRRLAAEGRRFPAGARPARSRSPASGCRACRSSPSCVSAVLLGGDDLVPEGDAARPGDARRGRGFPHGARCSASAPTG